MAIIISSGPARYSPKCPSASSLFYCSVRVYAMENSNWYENFTARNMRCSSPPWLIPCPTPQSPGFPCPNEESRLCAVSRDPSLFAPDHQSSGSPFRARCPAFPMFEKIGVQPVFWSNQMPLDSALVGVLVPSFPVHARIMLHFPTSDAQQH